MRQHTNEELVRQARAAASRTPHKDVRALLEELAEALREKHEPQAEDELVMVYRGIEVRVDISLARDHPNGPDWYIATALDYALMDANENPVVA